MYHDTQSVIYVEITDYTRKLYHISIDFASTFWTKGAHSMKIPELFDLTEVIRILNGAVGMPAPRVRNWVLGRPLKIEGSVRTTKRTLYSEADILRIGCIYELSKAGTDAKGIAKALGGLRKDLKAIPWLTFWAVGEGEFRVVEGQTKPDALVWHTVNVGGLVDRLQKEIAQQIEKRQKGE